MDTVKDSDCDDCALPVDTGECKCDVPGRFSVEIAVDIHLSSTARQAYEDALDILNFDHTKTNDYVFGISDWSVTKIKDPKDVP